MNGQLVREVRITWMLFALLIVLSLTATASETKEEISNKSVLTPKIYSHILFRKREEHKIFVKHLLNSNYETSYKLLEIAFGKIFDLFHDLNATFIQSGYSPEFGFPSDDVLLGPVTLVIENTCLAAEVVLHMPDKSYRIFEKYPQWKDNFNWSLDFVAEFSEILNDETATMLDSFRAEINNPSSRKDSAISFTEVAETKAKKKKKRIKKGPRLVARNEL